MINSRSISAARIAAYETQYGLSPESRDPVLTDENRNQSMKTGVEHRANQRYKSVAAASSKAPPVMMKMISTVNSSAGVSDLLHYLNKEESVVIENNHGEAFQTAEEVGDYAKAWRENLEARNGSSQGRSSRQYLKHGVIVLPRFSDRESALEIARESLGRVFGEVGLEYVMAGHFEEDGQNPHVHFGVNRKMPNGEAFHFGREFIFNLREAIADASFSRGVLLHQGMAYERNVESRTTSRKQLEEGVIRKSKPLTDDSKEKLVDPLNILKGQLNKAAIRTPALDGAVKKQVEAIESKGWSSVKVIMQKADRDLVDDYDMEI